MLGEAASRCPDDDGDPPRGAGPPAPGHCRGIAREVCPRRCSPGCTAALARMDANPPGCAVCTDKQLGLFATGEVGLPYSHPGAA